MKSAIITLFSLAAAIAVGVPGEGSTGAAAGACEQMTAERLLENPQFAKRWSDAVKSGDPEAIERMHELLSQLRALHGCDGDAAHGAARPEHALPPGHPPVDGGEPATPGSAVFEEPSTLTI